MAHPLPHQIPNDAKPYHIVHFSDDSTYVVPEWWLDRSGPNLVAFWPPYSTKEQLVQVVQRRDQITQDWSVHPARILHSCATLQQALDGIDEEEDTSSLESDSPQQPVRKRSKPRRLFDHRENRPPAEPQQGACFPQDSPHDEEPAVFHNLEVASRRVVPVEAVGAAALPNGAVPHLSAVERDVCACGASGASSMKSLMKEMWQDLADRQDAFFERVLSNQANLLARVNALRDQAAQGVLVPVLPDDCPTLPASSPAEMKALNTYLKKKEKLDQMATYFRQNGGKDHKAAARAVLGLLISNSVAKCCSWAGSHGAKEALLDYGNILELVLAALKPKFNMADRSTVAAVAKRWLSSSGDRDGGRANRRRPNNCQKTREK
ncbi:uncharacterized protein ISCGN_031527 [Ixodes scapularis]